MHQQLSLFSLLPSPISPFPTPQSDPYWDVIEDAEDERENYGVREQVLDNTSTGCKPDCSVPTNMKKTYSCSQSC